MDRENYRGWAVVTLALMVVAGCDTSGGGKRLADASALQGRDGDGGLGDEDGGRGPRDREGGIVIGEDAGVVNSCDVRTQFRCGDGRCIIRARQCDRTIDCADRSDEAKCGARCGVGDFVCNDGTCVDPSDRCDGVRQCSDASDELGCSTTCTGFRCSDSTCVNASDRCDQIVDCADGSDEAGCASSCTVEPAPLPRWNGVSTLTQVQYMECNTLCGQDDSCYTDANCPGIETFNDCLNTEALACSVNRGGSCHSDYKTLTCCGDDRCGDDTTCIETQCSSELQSVRDCIAADQICLRTAGTRCFAP